MFRRFGVIDSTGVEVEVLINLSHIISIFSEDSKTVILLRDGHEYYSSIDKEYLLAAMDGMTCS